MQLIACNMQIDVIDTWNGFCGLRQTWESVYKQDREAGYFLSWPWLAKVFEAKPKCWQVIAVKPNADNSDHVCFFPIRLKTRWSKSGRQFKTAIECAGKLSSAQYTGFVCLPEWESRAIVAIASTLRGMSWERLSIKNDSCERRLNLFLSEFETDDYVILHREYKTKKGMVDNLVCPYISLPQDFETYLQTHLSSNTRQKIRRFWRKFETRDDLRISNSTVDTYHRDLRVLLEMWFKKWAPVRGRRIANQVVKTYEKNLGQSQSLGAVHIPVLWREEQPLGALGNIVDWQKRHLYFIAAGRDETVRDTNIGLLLHTHSIRWAIENDIGVYDFCHGNEPYKYSFGATDRRISSVTITPGPKSSTGQLDIRPAGGEVPNSMIKSASRHK
jgi:hypothetical protein